MGRRTAAVRTPHPERHAQTPRRKPDPRVEIRRQVADDQRLPGLRKVRKMISEAIGIVDAEIARGAAGLFAVDIDIGQDIGTPNDLASSTVVLQPSKQDGLTSVLTSAAPASAKNSTAARGSAPILLVFGR